MWLCGTASIGHSLPAASNPAVQILAQLQNQQVSPYTRLLSERAKRGLFSNLAGLATGGLTGGNKEPDEDASPLKPKPYDFNEVEMTAIQAMISLRDVIGVLLQKVGFNIPSLASLINRSENGVDKVSGSSGFLSDSSSSALSALTSTKSSNVGVQVLRGLALTLPLLIPMATQMRRNSLDSSLAPSLPISIPHMPMYPDIYYNQAMHRRRGKRSINLGHDQKWASAMTVPAFRGAAVQHLLNSRPILSYLRRMEAKYAKSAM